MLPRASFSNEPCLSHASCEHGLRDGVVNLVGACMGQVFSLEPDGCPPGMARQVGGSSQGSGAADIGCQQIIKLGQKCRVTLGVMPSDFKFIKCSNQSFGDIPAAELTEASRFVRFMLEWSHCHQDKPEWLPRRCWR